MADLRLIFRKNPEFCKAAGLLVVLSIVLFKYIHLLLLIWCLLAGTCFCHFTLSPNTLLPNLLLKNVRKKKVKKREDDELALLKRHCPVCGKDGCNRHRPELNILALQPWSNLNIPQKVDAALEEFLTNVIKEYVYTWYRDLSQDEAFVNELRMSLRFIAAVLLRRLQKVDIPELIIDRVLPAALRHLDCCLKSRAKLKPSQDPQQALLEGMSPHLHCAIHSRQSELAYLKQLAENVFPFILPIQSLKCKSLCVLLREILSGGILLSAMDVIADPDMINNLLLVFLDESLPPVNYEAASPHVNILASFAQLSSKKTQSCLYLELAEILSNPTALFPFMQFLKQEASVNVLQFYLSVEEFNVKILRPDITEAEIVLLHSELKDMYRMYCSEQAVDRIQFDKDIIEQLKSICEGPPESVVKLQTSTPLFRAYEHAYGLLEKTFLPLFHQSDDYYQMMCGERLPTRLNRNAARALKRNAEALSMARLGNKIKGVFKTTTLDGGLCEDDVDTADEPDATMSLRSDSFEDDLTGYFEEPLRDLSAWRVTIPHVEPRPDPENLKKESFPFVIDVRRLDITDDNLEPNSWKVDRRYNEFYVLEQKLSEFHGEFEDAALPPKKAFGTKNKGFLESKLTAFEDYLQKLLTKPNLKGSELLYHFLTSDMEMTSSFLPDINLGKMFKRGAMRLVTERGKHLDPFLQSLHACSEGTRPKPCKSDSDSDSISLSSEKMANSIYENNADVPVQWLCSPSDEQIKDRDVEGAFDAIIYLARTVYNAPRRVIHMFMGVRILLKNTLETYLDWYIGHKLDQLFEEHRIVQLVGLLQDTLFFDTDPPRTDDQKRQRQIKALSELKQFIPRLFVHAVGEKNHNYGTELIFNLLQQPKLNKQLSYTLLDIVVEELFPELATKVTEEETG